ncbi:MAG: hypothetical protein ACYDHX_10075 [Methanothrix sp.]
MHAGPPGGERREPGRPCSRQAFLIALHALCPDINQCPDGPALFALENGL